MTVTDHHLWRTADRAGSRRRSVGVNSRALRHSPKLRERFAATFCGSPTLPSFFAMRTTRNRSAIAASGLLLLLLSAGGVTRAQGPEPSRADVEKLTKQNGDFRRVLFTADHVQIVAMALPPNEDIGAEVHQVDQCFFIVEGRAETTIAGQVGASKQGDVICVPAGLRHNVRNPGPKALKLYTLYSPPQHPAGTIHHTKQDAEKAESAKQPRGTPEER